jgi:alpha-beta hydrolase superfamily lysophospholipase
MEGVPPPSPVPAKPSRGLLPASPSGLPLASLALLRLRWRTHVGGRILARVSQPESIEVRTADGIALHTELWRPEGAPKLVVVVVHGGAEHVGRYARLAGELNAMGALVLGPDHRGQGRSGGAPGHVESFEQYADDLLAVLRHHAKLLGDEGSPSKIPWFMWAHSMGGLITLTYLLDHQRDFQLRGAVVSAPLLGLAMKVGLLKRWLVLGVAKLLPRLKVPTGIPPEYICRDPAEVDRYRNDPRRVTNVTPRWAVAMEDAMARVAREAGRIELPMHWYLGTGDKIVDSEVTQQVFASLGRAKERGQTLEVWPGYYHELHNEPDDLREPVMTQARAWIRDRI